MAIKLITMPQIGPVSFYKRRGTKSIRLRLTADGEVRVTMPYWLPYRQAEHFVRQKQAWLIEQQTQRSAQPLKSQQQIGKSHRLVFIAQPGLANPHSRIAGNEVRVYHSADLPVQAKAVQTVAQAACLRALKLQAQTLLPQRLASLAAQHDFSYRQVGVRQLKSRWGSCSSDKDITLNFYLMQLPWRLIDYVLVHELVHTQHLNHSRDFWDTVERLVPDTKDRRRELKQYQPSVWRSD